MSDDDQLQVIRSSPLGAELGNGDIKTLIGAMHVRRLEDKEVLAEENTVDNALHLLAEGKLVVSHHSVSGELTLHVMQPGELAGAMGFLDGLTRTATLRADGEAVVYSLEREAFEGLIEHHPQLVYRIMRAVTRAAHEVLLGLNQQVEELTNYITRHHGRY